MDWIYRGATSARVGDVFTFVLCASVLKNYRFVCAFRFNRLSVENVLDDTTSSSPSALAMHQLKLSQGDPGGGKAWRKAHWSLFQQCPRRIQYLQ